MPGRHRIPRQLSSQEIVSDSKVSSGAAFSSEMELLDGQRSVAAISQKIACADQFNLDSKPIGGSRLAALSSKANGATVRLPEADPLHDVSLRLAASA